MLKGKKFDAFTLRQRCLYILVYVNNYRLSFLLSYIKNAIVSVLLLEREEQYRIIRGCVISL